MIILENFKEKSENCSDLCYSPRNLLETLMIARHYGLPTRLLDWSHDPLVALFFAVWEESHWGKDGIVWCFDSPPQTVKRKDITLEEIRDIENRDHSKHNQVYILEVDSGLQKALRRIRNQKACFTLHTKSFKCLTKLQEHSSYLTRIIVDKDSKSNILRELNTRDINDNFLSPDLIEREKLSNLCKKSWAQLSVEQKEMEVQSRAFLNKKLEEAKNNIA